MSNKPEREERHESLGEDQELKLIDEACERLLRAMNPAEAAPATTATTANTLKSAVRKTAGYVAVALAVLVVGTVGAQDQPTARVTGTAATPDSEETEEERADRLEEATDAREDAREAREEEREEFEENAAQRAERRQDARVERWALLAEQGGLRSPSQLSEQALDELRIHARREARLRAIRHRAVEAGDSVTVTRADAVLEREALRHDVALSPLLAAPREHTAGHATKLPAGGAQ